MFNFLKRSKNTPASPGFAHDDRYESWATIEKADPVAKQEAARQLGENLKAKLEELQREAISAHIGRLPTKSQVRARAKVLTINKADKGLPDFHFLYWKKNILAAWTSPVREIKHKRNKLTGRKEKRYYLTWYFKSISHD